MITTYINFIILFTVSKKIIQQFGTKVRNINTCNHSLRNKIYYPSKTYRCFRIIISLPLVATMLWQHVKKIHI